MTKAELKKLLMKLAKADLAAGAKLEDHPCYIAIQTIDGCMAEAIGWAYADCCMTLDRGGDPRENEMPDVLARAQADLAT